ncbi:hypothetical protein Ahy_B04g068988 [Arachis hypogaea]|uniref:Uncharacterized protein n=1 Tax=Arachis hypogaea TaxID=3818 RepID=A0A444ZBC1_ARAHY|nr:hypothetical protein Ahy_B04g068988 [Arachis hypogaea]
MIFQSFTLDNLIYLCMKIMNSIIVVGLYYEFRSTFSIGLSYLFLLQARIMQEEAEKKLSATIRHYVHIDLLYAFAFSIG